jgi:hypothetical protein
MSRFVSTFVVLCLLAAMAFSSRSSTAQETPKDEKVFFAFDDQNLAWKHNLRLTMQKPTKHPDNPVLRVGPRGAPDHGHALLYGSVLRMGGKFRMWYLGMIQRELEAGQAPGWWRPMCYAESDDGVHWTKPELNLVELDGNARNNICKIEGDPHSMTLVNDFLSVMHDPDDPDPARRYKCVYIAHMPHEDIRGGMSGVGIKEGRVGAICTAVSADGLSWKNVGDRPANAGGERFEVSGLYRFNGFYYATGQLASPWCWLDDGRDVGRLTMAYRSPDFVHWSKAKATAMVLSQQSTDPQPGYEKLLAGDGKQMHMGFGLWNRGNVLVGLHGVWQGRGPEGKDLKGLHIDLGLCLSNDGVHWREPLPNQVFVERGAEKEWDSIALLQGHAFANVDDKTYIWYSHWDCEDGFRSQEIGLATFPRDRFACLSRHDPGDPAHVVSSVIVPGKNGAKISVNVSGASDAAPILVELLNDRDEPIAGFSGKDAAKITSDSVRATAKWPKGATTPGDRPMTIKVTLPDNDEAKLYAIYVEPAR